MHGIPIRSQKKLRSERKCSLDKAFVGHGGGGAWYKASVLGCLPLAAPIGLSPLLILTLCGSWGGGTCIATTEENPMTGNTRMPQWGCRGDSCHAPWGHLRGRGGWGPMCRAGLLPRDSAAIGKRSDAHGDTPSLRGQRRNLRPVTEHQGHTWSS